MVRTISEWIAKHDDQTIPPRVRLRVFEKYNGICQLSQTKIYPGTPWEADHKIELWDGGEHRESNLQPVLKAPHKRKSALGKTTKAKSDRLRAAHIGIPKPKSALSKGKWKRKLDGTVVLREEE